MATLTIDISDFGAASHPDDFVTLWSPIFRRVGTTSKLVSTAPRRVYLASGKASVDVEPGPLAVEMHCRNVVDSSVREFNVPDGGGSLAELVEAYSEYEAPVVSRVHADLLAAIEAANAAAQSASDAAESVEVIGGAQAVLDARDAASSSASAAAQSASDAASSASDASDSASAASGSATNAADSASAAATSASNAATSESNSASSASTASSKATAADTSATNAASSASAAATSASNAKTSETNAKTSETNAAGSASAASGSASAAAQSASDAQVAAAQAASGVPDATASVKGKIKLAGDLGGTADAPTVPGLANKANVGHTHASVDVPNTPEIGEWAGFGRKAVTTWGSGWFSILSDPTAADHPARKNYVDASIIACPKMHVWNGSGSWVAPPTAGPNDSVLNTSTGEIYSVKVV